MRSDVSVVIPAHNQSQFLIQVLTELCKQSVCPDEIIVVHSGMHDPTEVLHTAFPGIEVIHLEKLTLAGAARNVGAQRAQGKWLAFLDSDVLPKNNWLKELRTAIQEHPNHFVTGSLGYATTGGYWGLCLWAVEFSIFHPYMPSREIEGGLSANMLVDAEVFRRAGGFPDQFVAGEDTFLSAQLREIGLRNWFCASAVVEHFNIHGFRHCLSHLYILGSWSAICRRLKPITGSEVVKYWPAPILIWAIRFFLLYQRVLRFGRGYRMQILSIAPGVLLALIAWNLGFLAGLLRKVPDRKNKRHFYTGVFGGLSPGAISIPGQRTRPGCSRASHAERQPLPECTRPRAGGNIRRL